ncbi:hypothetical protein B0675_40045 [Streptomyces sp. M41(2017)]|uniref:hypothetical protein n=1 Tax=Streptomyces sp. M41(2017) TaxID=1955065 RepID=UPI0009BFB1F0|nr:hypothetical protein [Streptomyces sp. M41(2017)]OQQ13012.1 hypothetical protein B0675_40045 [Streptomyces sp. M41(2017)]
MNDLDVCPLTDAELLAWVVIIEYRRRRMRDGAAILLPYPRCSTCRSHVIKVEVLPSRLATLAQPIVMHPCGHGYLAEDDALNRIFRHAEAMLDILDGVALGEAGQPWWNTDGIIREAQLRVAPNEPAATEPAPCPACSRADQAGLAPAELHPECVRTQP